MKRGINVTIEDEVFSRYRVMEERLELYGFRIVKGIYIYEITLPEDDFRIVITYDGIFSGKIIDLSIGEEYTNFRLTNATGFSAGIREKYKRILLDIRDMCCLNRYFRTPQAQRINDFIFDIYEGQPEFLWPSIPTYGAYRLKGSKKWYAIIGSVPLYKVDASSDSAESVEVINVKVDSAKIKEILASKGYYPAFHMNKKCWVSIILDETLPDEEIQRRVRDSYAAI